MRRRDFLKKGTVAVGLATSPGSRPSRQAKALPKSRPGFPALPPTIFDACREINSCLNLLHSRNRFSCLLYGFRQCLLLEKKTVKIHMKLGRRNPLDWVAGVAQS